MARSAPLSGAQQIHQHAVLAEPFRVGQGTATAGETKEQLGEDGDWGKPGPGAFPALERGFIVDSLPEVEAAAEGR